jgi:hypothetical protein
MAIARFPGGFPANLNLFSDQLNGSATSLAPTTAAARQDPI